jgi:bifunctional DNA-binding transcriptional regulator/antitoxin component of YhaV-PrlF toxin-antitoxin module
MIKAETKKWGNSIGIVIPKSVVEELNLKPHEEVQIDIKRSGNALKGLFGTLQWKKPIREVLREARKELESKYDR